MSINTDSGQFYFGDGDGRRAALAGDVFLRLRDLIYLSSGIYFGEDSRPTLERRLRPRVEALGLGGFAQYLRRLTSGEGAREELQSALDAVAVHETYFFREARALRAFGEEMLPEVAARRGAERALRVWSAGCSTGEEPYTLAMLVEESGLFAGWRVELSASDLSNRVITEARAGRYDERSFRTMDARRRARYFAPAGGGGSLIAERLRAAVNYDCFNILDERADCPYTDLDVIFCRNVMLYFGAEARQRTVSNFQRRLRPGGYLVLGASESLFSLDTPLRLVHLRNELVYQKQ